MSYLQMYFLIAAIYYVIRVVSYLINIDGYIAERLAVIKSAGVEVSLQVSRSMIIKMIVFGMVIRAATWPLDLIEPVLISLTRKDK